MVQISGKTGTECKSAQLIIVDDHGLAREGLRDMLADEPELEVVGEAANGLEALALCSQLQPDLVLMDVRMPRLDGLKATRKVKQEFPTIIVLILTMYENPDYLLEALRAGAAGYVLKDAPREEVVTAVWQALGGESPLDPELVALLLRRLATEVRGREGAPRGLEMRRSEWPYYAEPLTPREREVLELMKLGHTNRQIARELWISSGTAKNHVEHIIQKLGVSGRTQAVTRALGLGILEMPR
jgi:DNA-binding NarL/FixJ family response regulator